MFTPAPAEAQAPATAAQAPAAAQAHARSRIAPALTVPCFFEAGQPAIPTHPGLVRTAFPEVENGCLQTTADVALETFRMGTRRP